MGNLELIKRRWPQAEVWAVSEYPERDSKWYAINFFASSVYAVSPIKIIKLAYFARKFDVVFWGGGELLKDYTNILSVFYWYFKISLVRIFNSNIFGLYQGIGPTKSRVSKFFIARTVNKTKAFLVRDKKSKLKLLEWGVKTPVVSSYDPAILISPQPAGTKLRRKIEAAYNLDSGFLDNFVGVGPRKWFHYQTGGLLPYFIKKRFAKPDDSDYQTYVKNLVRLLDTVCQEYDVNVVLFPMHVSPQEGDVELAKSLREAMAQPKRVLVIDRDNLTPAEYLSLIGLSKFFIGFRLHSTILSVISKVPTLNFYYVDKGRLFFEQIGLRKFSLAIESLLQGNLTTIKGVIKQVAAKNQRGYSPTEKLSDLRKQIRQDFDNIMNKYGPDS